MAKLPVYDEGTYFNGTFPIPDGFNLERYTMQPALSGTGQVGKVYFKTHGGSFGFVQFWHTPDLLTILGDQEYVARAVAAYLGDFGIKSNVLQMVKNIITYDAKILSDKSRGGTKYSYVPPGRRSPSNLAPNPSPAQIVTDRDYHNMLCILVQMLGGSVSITREDVLSMGSSPGLTSSTLGDGTLIIKLASSDDSTEKQG